MTEPDEALLWAREYWAVRLIKSIDEDSYTSGVSTAEAYRSGKRDHKLSDEAHAYRAGAAASEARIKELELFVAQIAHRFVPKKMPLGLLRSNCFSESSQARALLKEADQ